MMERTRQHQPVPEKTGTTGPPGQTHQAMRLVTLRAMAIACALMPLLALWVYLSEAIWYSGHSTTISLFYHVTFGVFLIASLCCVP